MIQLRKYLVPCLSILLLVSCSFPGIAAPQVQPGAALPVNPPLLVQAPDGSTGTPTPFRPQEITPTVLPTDFPATSTPTITASPVPSTTVSKSWADYPGPSVWPDIAIPAPAGLLPQPSGQVNILLMGSDQRPTDGGFRTDTLLLATLNPKDGTANITSFPRDLYVYIPGWTIQRINTAHAHGGFELTQLTFEYNFGVRPDHYVLVNFSTFSEVIDDIGGIDVNVARPFTDQRDKHGDYTVYAGVRHMDGETALWYVRARYTTNDFDRGRRQQEVLQALFVKMLSLNAVSKAPQLYDTYRRNVTTDLTLNDVTPLLPLAATLSDTSRIHHYYIAPEQVIPYLNINGAQVLIPNRPLVMEVMHQALNCPQP